MGLGLHLTCWLLVGNEGKSQTDSTILLRGIETVIEIHSPIPYLQPQSVLGWYSQVSFGGLGLRYWGFENFPLPCSIGKASAGVHAIWGTGFQCLRSKHGTREI